MLKTSIYETENAGNIYNDIFELYVYQNCTQCTLTSVTHTYLVCVNYRDQVVYFNRKLVQIIVSRITSSH